jgi:hypothetical protein
MSDYGIDYSGSGATCNRDTATGIRYGIIHSNDLRGEAIEDFEADYGPATCPKCGNEAVEYDPSRHGEYDDSKCRCNDFACEGCEYPFTSDDAYGDEPRGYILDDSEYKARIDSDGDVWVFASPYFTYARFCSPCAPGACSLLYPVDEGGPRAYCLGHDWFEDDRAPYPVYCVSDGALVQPEGK